VHLRRAILPYVFAIALFTVGVPSVKASTQQLICTPADLVFSKVIVGQTKTLPVTMTNTGTTSVTVSQMKVSLSVFSVSNLNLPLTLTAGQKIQFYVTFTPTTAGRSNGSAVFTSNASNRQLYLPLRGMGVNGWSLTANPSSLAFGNVQVGLQQKMPVVLTNAGTSAVTLSQGWLAGVGFRGSGITLPLTLSGGQSFTFTMIFAPQSTGTATGSLSLSSPTDPILKITLEGTGIAAGQLAVSPTSINFGDVAVGSSASQNGTLSASGASVTVSSATSSNSQFTLHGLSLPVTIAAGQSAPFSVLFAPQATGSMSATLSFTSNAGNSPTTESLTGTGTPPSVYLSWTASTSPGVVGYNIYRHGSSGSYTKINSSLDPATNYTDASVASGETYYYATTAVNSSGEESGYSNQVEVVIP
jgi:hypothetical protein